MRGTTPDGASEHQPGPAADQHASPASAQATLPGQGYAVLWDVDGVIIDSGEQHRAAWEALAAAERLPFDNTTFWSTFGQRNADVIPTLYGIAGPPERLASIGARKEEMYRALLERGAVALPGARELMRALHAARYRQALGSSAPPENQAVIIRLLDLAPHLDAIVSGEQVAHGKPAPDIYLRAAELVGVPPARCLVIEDAVAGIEAAHAAGMRCLAVRRAGHSDPPGLATADRVVDSLRDVDVALVTEMLHR